MKVVFIGTSIEASLNFRSSLIQLLIEQGYRVFLFATDYSTDSKQKVLNLGAIPIDSPLNRSSFNPFLDIWGTFKLIKILKDIKPDVVFSFFSKPVIFGTLSAYFAKTPKIIGMLEGLGYFFTIRPEKDSFKIKCIRKVQAILYKICFKKLDLLILLNSDDEKDLVQNYNLNVNSLHILGGIGISLKDYSYSKPVADPITFIFVGRMLFDKGIREFIKAATNVKKRYSNVGFKIAGNIDLKNPSSLTIEEKNSLEKDGVIEFMGFKKDIRPFLKESSVFVLPSYREGVPLSTQEAMATGRPIITTNVPGCKETVVDGKNGFIVPPFDAEALAIKMIYFIEHPNSIEEMGKKSYDLAKKMFNRFEKDDILRQLILNHTNAFK
ncbi:MAG: N,N'-diacetylbacillosaminyl-diphospho-undecaprenol alpha-1,3-N-acetylgalactosaminyltransferase [Holosporales bacterium]